MVKHYNLAEISAGTQLLRVSALPCNTYKFGFRYLPIHHMYIIFMSLQFPIS